jgi:hypothetical protein
MIEIYNIKYQLNYGLRFLFDSHHKSSNSLIINNLPFKELTSNIKMQYFPSF